MIAKEDKPTTKQCPQCGNTELAKIGTHNYKHCLDCNLDIPWYREDGEAPLYGGVVQEKKE